MTSRASLLGATIGVLVGATNAQAAPNILVAIADDWGLHAGAYGTRWVKTPAFDRVAREGLLFSNAYTPNAKCAPSRACFLTGRNSWQLKEAANHTPYFPPEFKGWMESLNDNNWFVGHTRKGWGPGVANDANGQPRQMTGVAFNEKKATPPTTGMSQNDYAANFTEFLNAAPNGKPWCFWYGSTEPHRSYEVGSGITKGGKKLTDIERVPVYWPDNETVRKDMLDYALEVEYFDSHLSRMMSELEKRGQLDNTLILVTSDHGMPFPRVKGHTYEDANHVPFAVRWPQGINQAGRAVNDFVSFIDVAPTMLEVAGVASQKSGMAPMEGNSLVEILRNDKKAPTSPQRDHVLVGKERNDVGRPHDWGYPTRAIIKRVRGNEWMYIKNYEPQRWPGGNPETGYTDSDSGATKTTILEAHRANPLDKHWALCFGIRPTEELYNLSNDPNCVLNVANQPRRAALKKGLLIQMESELKEQGDPRMSGQGHIFDEYQNSTPRNVGFYERFMRGEDVKAGWVNPSDIEKQPLNQ